jgi:hypothetical protein
MVPLLATRGSGTLIRSNHSKQDALDSARIAETFRLRTHVWVLTVY